MGPVAEARAAVGAVTIVCAVRWYLRDSLSYHEGQELLAERGYAPVTRPLTLSAVLCAGVSGVGLAHLKRTTKSWRVNETYAQAKAECAGQGTSLAGDRRQGGS